MTNWSSWYRTLVLIWAVLAAPGMFLAILWSGGDIAPVEGDPVSLALWFACVGFFLAPIVLFPWRNR